jgi:drug/metabolite transporter (DMT)-like permease
MKAGLAYTDPAVFAALRISFAAVFLFLVMIVLRRPLRPVNWRATLLIGLLGTGAFTGLTFWALHLGAAGKTSVLYYTMPIWLLIISRVVLHERVRGFQWLYVGVALAGLVLVISPWDVGGTIIGNLLAVGAGVFSAVAAVLVKTLLKNEKCDVLSLTAWQTLFGSVPLVIIAFVYSDSGPQWTGWFVGALLYNVMLVSGLAMLLWFFSLRHLPAGTAGLGRLLAPVVGVLASWLQLGEIPNGYETAGMVLILLGLAALAVHPLLSERRARVPAPAAASLAVPAPSGVGERKAAVTPVEVAAPELADERSSAGPAGERAPRE